MKQTSIKQMLFGTSPIHMKQKLSKVATALLFTSCFALLPKAQAINPKPGGGYPGGNTAEGQSALFSLTSGIYNTALGWSSLSSNTAGKFNTGTGAGTLLLNRGDQNTAIGGAALLSNSTGTNNTANGAFALFGTTTGNGNIALGASAGMSLTTGDNNIDTGNGGVTRESEITPMGDPDVQESK